MRILIKGYIQDPNMLYIDIEGETGESPESLVGAYQKAKRELSRIDKEENSDADNGS